MIDDTIFPSTKPKRQCLSPLSLPVFILIQQPISTKDTMISVRELTKVYRQPTRDVVALDNINLDIDDGEIHGIIGRSGAGKSTLVRCLTLLDRPNKGGVVVGNHDLTAVTAQGVRPA